MSGLGVLTTRSGFKRGLTTSGGFKTGGLDPRGGSTLGGGSGFNSGFIYYTLFFLEHPLLIPIELGVAISLVNIPSRSKLKLGILYISLIQLLKKEATFKPFSAKVLVP